MRPDPPGSLLTAPLREPRHVVAIIYPTGSIYFTSKVGMTNVPGQVVQGVLQNISSISQQLYPDDGRATIGAMSFSVVDVDGDVTELIRSQLQTFDYGIRQREVRVWTGDSDDFNLLTRVETYIVDDVVELHQRSYRFSCSDRSREMRDDIFEQVGTRLTSSYAPGDSVLNVQSTAGFEMLEHTAAFTDAPSATVGYVRLRKTGEKIRYTGKTPTSFTGCVGERFGTIAQEIVVDPATDADRLPEVEELIYLEMPGPQFLYAVQTGTILGTSITLPERWHLGMETTSINDALYSAIGVDLFDPNDHSKGLILRFVDLQKTDGKRFCEKQLHVPMMTFPPIDAFGRIGLRRVAPLLSTAAPVAVLNETNVISYSAVVHNQSRVINVATFDWNFNGEEYTRPEILFNLDSIVRFGIGARREYEFAGLYVSRHSRATIQRIMDALTDRYGAPPIEVTLQLSSTLNYLEIGDVVLLQLSEVRDYAGVGTLNRTFEIQSISRNWVTGELTARVFGSTARIAQQINTNLGSVLSDAWLTGTGTALNTVLTMIGDNVSASGDLPAGTYYHDGDVIIPVGVTITVNGNVQLRTTGELIVNGRIDGKGRGLAAIADPNTVGQGLVEDLGAQMQTFGSTRGSAGIYYGGSGRYIGYGIPPNGRVGIAATPRFALATVAGELLGLPQELRGTPGVYGWPIVDSTMPFDVGAVSAKGGAGGNGGAGLALIGRGLSRGVSGQIDLSGDDGSAPVSDVTLGGRSLRPGAGGGGSPGSLLVVLDGDNLPLPDLTNALVVMHGATPQSGSRINFEPSVNPPAEPWTGEDAGLGAFDVFEGAHVIQYAPRDLTLESSDDELVQAPSLLVADGDGVSVRLTWVPPPEDKYDYVEVWESINNDRANAVRLALVRGSTWETASDVTVTRYFWARAAKLGIGVSEWEPVLSNAGVVVTFGGAAGTDGQDAVEVAVTTSAPLQFVQAQGGAWSHDTVDVTFTFKQGGIDIATHVIRFTRSDDDLTGATFSEGGEATAEAFVGNGTPSATAIVTHVASGVAAAIACSAVMSGAQGEPGRQTLNGNPTFSSADGTVPSFARWNVVTGNVAVVTLADGVAGRFAARATNDSQFLADRMALDASKTYRVGAWVRSALETGKVYLLVAFYDASGANITPGQAPWGTGTYHYWGLVEEAPPTAFERYELTFGPRGEFHIPSGAVECAIGALLNYGAGTDTIDVQDLGLVEDAATQLDFAHVQTFRSMGLRTDTRSFQKVQGENLWDAHVYSVESYRACAASWQPAQATANLMLALDTAPSEDADYTSLDYALHCTGSGGLQIFESGTYIGGFGSHVAGDQLSVEYDGFTVRYKQNGVVLREVADAGKTFFFDSSFYTVGAQADNVSFAPITQGPIPLSQQDIAARGWQFDGAFSSTDADTVAWTAGTFRSADGTSYSIGIGNTGNMTAPTFIYLDIAVSLTALQTTTSPQNAVGAGKVLIAVAEDNATGSAFFQAFGGAGGFGGVDLSVDVTGQLQTAFAAAGLINANITINADGTLSAAGGGQASLNSLPGAISAGQINANAVTTAKLDALAVTAAKIAANAVETDKINANAVTAAKIAANTITAAQIAADTITANNIAATFTWAKDFIVSTDGKIRQGKTSASDSTNAGIYIGYDGSSSYDIYAGAANDASFWRYDGSTGQVTHKGRHFRTDAVIDVSALNVVLGFEGTDGNTSNTSFVVAKTFTPDFTGSFRAAISAEAITGGTGEWRVVRNGSTVVSGPHTITTSTVYTSDAITNSNVDDYYELQVRYVSGGGGQVVWLDARILGTPNNYGRWS